LIVAFKALKSILLVTLGVGFLLAVRRDPVILIWQLAEAVHLPVTSRLFDRLSTIAANVTPRRDIGLALTAFSYALLMATEGIGLYLRRTWARWFTIGATGSFIPVELYEIARSPRPLRIVVMALNVAVVAYLWRRKEVFMSDVVADQTG
jgi:uncharacterized membrane protein (DUF2068 family)